jgi:AraC-like DNA-binding protein
LRRPIDIEGEPLVPKNAQVCIAAVAMRIDYGHWLLTYTRRTVFEIATMAGFSDGAHFSREFRKRFSATRSVVRRGAGAKADTARETAGDVPADRRVFV